MNPSESEFATFRALANPRRVDFDKPNNVVEDALRKELNPPHSPRPPTPPRQPSTPPRQPSTPPRPRTPPSRSPSSVRSERASTRPPLSRYGSEQADDDTVEKQAVLIQLNQLQRDGVVLSRHFTMDDSLGDMTFELNRIQSNGMADNFAVLATTGMQVAMSVMEGANRKWGPVLRLDGLADTVRQNQSSYHTAFTQIYRKRFSGGRQLSPEMNLAFLVGGSALMTHFGQSADFDSMKTMFNSFKTGGRPQQTGQSPQQAEGSFTRRPTMRKPSTQPPPAPMPEPMPEPTVPPEVLAELDELRRERAVLRAHLHQQAASMRPTTIFTTIPGAEHNVEIIDE